jgi:hypothetical protein
MDSTVKKGLYYLGIVAGLYLLFFYILPIAFKIVGFALKILLFVFVWGAIAFIIVFIIMHIVKIIKKEK